MTTVRDATPEDAAALARLRVVMLEGLGRDVGDLSWVPAAQEHARRTLLDGSVLAAVVEEDGTVVSGGLARVWASMPGPGDNGLRAWILNVATEPDHRRQGHARAVVERLLARLDARGVVRTDLTASADGDALYRSLGFEPTSYPLLSRRPTTS